MLSFIAATGIVVGSYISAELKHLHYTDQSRTTNDVISGTVAGTIGSPIAMSVGLFPTLRFYSWHGWLAVPGMILAIVSSVLYFKYPSWLTLVLTLIGFVLWAHNNLLAFHALMSV